MAELTYFMLYESGQNIILPDGASVFQGLNPVMVLRPNFIPTNFSFACTFAIQNMDLQADYNIVILIKDSNDAEIARNESVIPKDYKSDSYLPKQYNGYIFNMNLHNVVFVKEDAYRFVIYLNGEFCGERIIPVYKKGEI